MSHSPALTRNDRAPGREVTHCVHGHEYTPENTLRNGEGWRYCRECNRVAARLRQRRLRAC